MMMTRNLVKIGVFGGLLALMALPEGALAQRGGGGGGGGGGTGNTATRRTFSPNGKIGEAMISSDAETRSIVIIADDETHEEIAKIVAALDQPKPQVLIKVIFMEVTHRDGKELGVEFFGSDGAMSASFGPTSGMAFTGPWNLNMDNLEATVRALGERGNTEVLSRPSVLTRNNQEAVIIVGQEVPFITNSRVDAQTGAIVNTIQYDDVGIILRVTPFITEEGLVEMIVAPEISSIGEETVPISGTVSVPVINKRSAETVVVTSHAQTIVIGGLMQDSKVETTRRVPILGDIPILGIPFRRKIKEDTKTELLIFVTPYVVQTPRSIPELNMDEIKRTKLTPGAFPQTSLDRYLDGVPIEAQKPKKGAKPKKSARAKPDTKAPAPEKAPKAN